MDVAVTALKTFTRINNSYQQSNRGYWSLAVLWVLSSQNAPTSAPCPEKERLLKAIEACARELQERAARHLHAF